MVRAESAPTLTNCSAVPGVFLDGRGQRVEPGGMRAGLLQARVIDLRTRGDADLDDAVHEIGVVANADVALN